MFSSILGREIIARKISRPGQFDEVVLDALMQAAMFTSHRSGSTSDALMRTAVGTAIRALGTGLTESTAAGMNEQLSESRDERTEFEVLIREIWGDAIDLAELQYHCALEAGMARLASRPLADDDLQYSVLLRLHASACLIASEILALLRTGHASGAHARWRSLHETAVVAAFIRVNGHVAERYLLHEVIESHKAAGEYATHAAVLGYEELSEAEMSDLKWKRDALVDRYGPGFASQYGWAGGTAGLGDRPRFSDIERACGMDHLRPHYRLASHATHANPKSITFNIGVRERASVMLAGPSTGGLADPGHGMCISLATVTMALLTFREPTLGDTVIGEVLLNLSEAAGDAFIAAHRDLIGEPHQPVEHSRPRFPMPGLSIVHRPGAMRRPARRPR